MIPIPFNEQFRLAVLEHFDVLDSLPEERFDRITRLASRCFDVPIAVVSLVADMRQWFKSSVGLDGGDAVRERSLCSHAIMDSEVFVVLDATRDPRFADNPLVTGDKEIRFYAGAPLVTAKGFRLGTLCLFDSRPREAFGDEDKAMLADLAAMVVEELYRRCATSGEGPDLRHGAEPADIHALERDEAQKAQLLFIASLSHELRTPLNAIIGFSEVLSQELFGPLNNDRYREYAQNINASGVHLTRFVNSILDYVKVEKGEIALHEDWVDVSATMRDCERLFTEQLRKAGQRLFSHSPDDLPLLKADPQLLMQMLVNLIGNSVKFTSPGGRIDVEAGLDADGGLVLSVTDSGVGIAPEDLPRVLAPFGQVDSALTRKHGGFGLGLSLTRQFVELHDGELSVTSEPGVGTTVGLHFPAYRSA